MTISWRNAVNFAGIESAILAAAESALTLGAEHVLSEATKLVPIEEGTLSRSGTTSTARDGLTVIAAVSYDTPYARRQHEDMSYRHDQERQAKFLEQPLMAEAAVVAKVVAATVAKALT